MQKKCFSKKMGIGGDFATKGKNVYEIYSDADFQALGTAGIITVSTAVTYHIMSDVVTSIEFVINSGSAFNLNLNYLGSITYTGSGTFFSGTGGNLTVTDGNIIAASGGTLFDHTRVALFDFWQFENVRFVAWNPGKIIYANAVFSSCVFLLLLDTMTFIDVNSVKISDFSFGFGATFDKPIFSFVNSAQIGSLVRINGVAGQFLGTGSLLRMGNGLNNDSQNIITNILVTGGTLFDETGDTGTFSAVADATISAEAITSVTDSSGVARFNYDGTPVVFLDQEIVNSTFSTNPLYNGTHIITATGSGWYEVSSIAFGSDETGSFLSNSVTLTDTTTTLEDEEYITLDTALSTDYDGSKKVYNQLTNTVQVNAVYTVTKTGTWSKKGLNQQDNRILVSNSPRFSDSHYIFFGYVNDNSDAVGTIINNTFRSLEFGTLIQASSTERFKLIDVKTGTIEYTGNEDTTLIMPIDFTTVSSGGAVEFRFSWYIDKNTGTFVALDDPNECMNELGGVAASTSLHAIIDVKKGYKVRPEVTRSTGSSGLTVRYATINIQGV